ncbi:DNA-binding protein [Acinetobacter baumannii]|uniref:helix-turn-helix transcriptional regulator n=1 Tax=Acinetobacter baumannii TaxID=470 RepID=UPI000E594C03|nr:AlpA family phage regulatory protein [Acinetobacter baumannii]AXX46524.1 DNA-binding protein [Acinetobacter baumannii]MCZ3087195.1 AlpA family phage regulatory protein [Acinetobacter baumannii]
MQNNIATPRLISRKQVEQITSLSRSSIYLLMSQGRFPKPIQIGDQRVAWVIDEINEWVEDRIQNARVN